MNVILSSQQQLRSYYGTAGLTAIEQALDELEAARAAIDIPSLRYMIEVGVPHLSVAGVADEWQAIVEQLGAIDRGLAAQNERIESVLIIGGPRIVPFGSLPNPVADRDAALLADCVYGAADLTLDSFVDDDGSAMKSYGVDWPVGRLPDADEALPSSLIQLIRAAAAQHAGKGVSLGPGVCYSTASWHNASESVCAEINTLSPPGGELQLILSPPATAERLDRSSLEQAQLIYCNLHGLIDLPFWYGQAADSYDLLLALRPSDLADLDLSGAVLVSAACYGAALNEHTPDSSMALMALSRGVAAFFGALVITYGPLQPPSSEADLLVLHLLRQMYGDARSIGEAFLQARMSMLRELLLQRGYLDDDDAKTLLGFLVYGDPTLRIVRDGAI